MQNTLDTQQYKMALCRNYLIRQQKPKYIKQHSQNIKDLVVYLDNALTDYQKRLASDSNRKKNKAGKSPVMKEKLPDWVTDEKARKNVLTEKGIQDGKEIDELLAKINKDK